MTTDKETLRQSYNNSKSPGTLTTALASRRFLWRTPTSSKSMVGNWTGALPSRPRIDTFSTPSIRAATRLSRYGTFAFCARRRDRLCPSAREVQGRQGNRDTPNLDRRKGTVKVARRGLPKYQDFRSASCSPGCGPSCNLVWKPRITRHLAIREHLFPGSCFGTIRSHLRSATVRPR